MRPAGAGGAIGRSPRPIVLFLSTGRCGTQWLTANLQELYGERAVVTHEPLGAGYRPRRHFRMYHHRPDDHPPVVRAHLDRVEEMSRDTIYIETGWPLFATIPLFLERFGDRARIVHLARHLVPTAASHTVHQCYFGSPRRDDYTRDAALDPALPGAIQKDERRRWGSLSAFEKCLFWCTEVHLYARELRERFPHVPFHRVRSEDLFAPDEGALRELVEFIGLPFEPALVDRASRRIDRWHHRNELEIDWRTIYRHPAAVRAARDLGYRLDDVDEEALERRYLGTPTTTSDNR